MGWRKFGQDISQDSTEVKIFNEGTGLVLPAIYTFTCGRTPPRTDTDGTLDADVHLLCAK